MDSPPIEIDELFSSDNGPEEYDEDAELSALLDGRIDNDQFQLPPPLLDSLLPERTACSPSNPCRCCTVAQNKYKFHIISAANTLIVENLMLQRYADFSFHLFRSTCSKNLFRRIVYEREHSTFQHASSDLNPALNRAIRLTLPYEKVTEIRASSLISSSPIHKLWGLSEKCKLQFVPVDHVLHIFPLNFLERPEVNATFAANDWWRLSFNQTLPPDSPAEQESVFRELKLSRRIKMSQLQPWWPILDKESATIGMLETPPDYNTYGVHECSCYPESITAGYSPGVEESIKTRGSRACTCPCFICLGRIYYNLDKKLSTEELENTKIHAVQLPWIEHLSPKGAHHCYKITNSFIGCLLFHCNCSRNDSLCLCPCPRCYFPSRISKKK